MPVHVTRKRSGYWYAGGSVWAAGESIAITERSTGCRARADADVVADRWNRQALDQLVQGAAGRIMIADCLASYLTRPGGVRQYDQKRVAEFNEIGGHRPLIEAPTAWRQWLASRGAGQMPSSIARWRNTFQAALNHGAAAHNITAPRLPSVRGGGGTERAVYLTDDERTRLLAAYSPAARRPILLMAYQGTRSGETLRLDWRNIDLSRRTIHIPDTETKTGRARTVPMHRRVRVMLYLEWRRQKRPLIGPVFLSARGAPYADTRGRGDRQQGGNPLSRAHETACRKTAIAGFRLHDWRHDFAHRMVTMGCDMRTLMDLCGWSSPRMAARYTAVTSGHLADMVGRLR